MDKKYLLRLAVEVTILAAAAALFSCFNTRYRPQPGDRQPTTWREYHREAKGLLTAGKFREAALTEKAALSLDPAAYKSSIDLGSAYIQTGDFIKAIAMLKKAEKLVALYPQDRANLEVVYYNLGLAYVLERKPDQAWQYLRKAFAVDTGAGRNRSWSQDSNPGFSFVPQDDFQGFRKQVEEDTAVPHMLQKRVRSLTAEFHAKRYERVVMAGRDYLADNPGTIHAFWFGNLIIKSLNAQGRYPESLEELDLLGKTASDAGARRYLDVLRARTLVLAREYKQAFESLLKLQGRREYDEWSRGEILEILRLIVKGTHGALDTSGWEEAVFPGRIKAGLWRELARHYYDGNDGSRAEQYVDMALAEDARETDDKSPALELYQFAGTIYDEKEDFSKAKDLWEGFIRRHPDAKTAGLARLSLMQIEMRRGDYAAAFHNLKRSQLSMIVLLATLLGIVVFAAFFILGLFLLSQLFFKQKLYEVQVSGIYQEKDLFKFMLYLFALVTFLPVGFLALNYYWQPLFEKTGLNPVMSSSLFMDAALVTFAVQTLRRKYRLKPEELGFVSRGPVFDAIIPLAVVLGTFVFFTFVGMLYEKLGTHMPSSGWKDVMQTEFVKKNNAAQIYWLFMGLVVVGPIAEELLFRVFLFNFIDRYSNHYWAAGISAGVFALCHQQFVMFPFFFSLGLILSFMYVKTRSIVGCMVTHALYNFTIFLVVFSFLT
ncbi:MAG: CPBP family glutamic-type intramembrane protease [Candidatus Omnitrophica bacterium]|nr:CPBP family glutamic-type intramembrane protease [Candidatus Omnitrophota bacterium]